MMGNVLIYDDTSYGTRGVELMAVWLKREEYQRPPEVEVVFQPLSQIHDPDYIACPTAITSSADFEKQPSSRSGNGHTPYYRNLPKFKRRNRRETDSWS